MSNVGKYELNESASITFLEKTTLALLGLGNDMKMKGQRLGVVIALMVFALILGFGSGKRITLIADENIQVMELLSGDKILGKIHDGQSIEVTSCEDLKHYIVPKVRFSAGTEGYVLKGKFHLIRHSAWQFSAGAISFSC